MSIFRTELLANFSQLESLAADWDRLWKGDARLTVFASFSWARATWRSYGLSRSLCTPVVRQDGRVVGILPLAIADGTLRFLAEPQSDYNDMLCDREAGAGVVESAFRALAESGAAWRRCILQNVPEDSNLFSHHRQIQERTGLGIRASFQAVCPNVDLSCNRDRILGDILKKKSLKRHEKELSRLGPLDFRHLKNREEARRHLPIFIRQHVGRTAMAGERSIFREATARAFYESLVDELDPSRELRFSVVEIAGKPVAYHFGFETNGVFIWYKPTFDIDYWDYSPGEVLIKRLFEYVRERDVGKFDFTIGDEAFKGRFANQMARNYAVFVFRPNLRGAVDRLALFAKDALKEHPAVFRAVKRIVVELQRASRAARNAIKRHGFAGVAKKLSAAVWRKAFFALDVVLVFSSAKDGQESETPGFEIREGTLSELACYSMTENEYVTASKLERIRQRLRHGDVVYTAWRTDELVHVAWTGTRSEIVASFELGEKCRIGLERPSTVIYDCWTPPAARGRGTYPTVLDMLAARTRQDARECWIYCRRENFASVRGIEKAGFRLRYRMRRLRLLGCIEFNQVFDEQG